MLKTIEKSFLISFSLLFLLIPLVLFPETSELFEFNKMIITYIATVVIVTLWFIKMVTIRKFIFKRTLLDFPIIAFLISQTISTILSIDPRTSFFGYYSRFNGGLLSSFSYALLYWAYVSNMESRATQKTIRFILLSSLITSIWAIFEHFGHSVSCLIFPEFGTFDVACWVQDVQNRVFSTFGQPNWLAAWLGAIIPITWALALNSKSKNKNPGSSLKIENFWLYFVLSGVFFITLLYTKSRSGILAFLLSNFVFWLLTAINWFKTKQKFLKLIYLFSFFNFSFLILALSFGTPWTPKFSGFFSETATANQEATIQGPALEVGGTESATIRRIVWQGTVDIWKHYPIFGTGVETFAYSYYGFRPKEHNLVSEWDYLYNKAHNEYLNMAATTGSIGLISYLLVILFSLLTFLKFENLKSKTATQNSKVSFFPSLKIFECDSYISLLNFALLSGYLSILATNFFGFSVVPISLLFFLYPAMAQTTETLEIEKAKSDRIISSGQKVSIALLFILAGYFLVLIVNYWYTDLLYARGIRLNDAGNWLEARKILTEVVKKVPQEGFYWDELGQATSSLAVLYSQEGNEELAKELAKSAFSESTTAVSLSPANVNFRRNLATRLVNLYSVDPQYILLARNTLEDAVKLAPTDAKLFYNLSLTYLRSEDYEKAIKIMEKTVDLKENYTLARYALALMYIDTKRNTEAKEQLEYILKNIDPNNPEAKRELNELGI